MCFVASLPADGQFAGHPRDAGKRAGVLRRVGRGMQMTEDKILDAMVEAAAAHFNIAPEPDDPDLPAVRRCMEAILTGLRAEGVVH